MFHNPANDSRRTIDVALEGNDFAQHQKMELEEGRGEDLRLLYVALTRARHQAVLWWAGAYDSQHSPLARLLFDRDALGVVGPYGAKTRDDASVEARLTGLGPSVSVERVALPSPRRWEEGDEAPPHLEAAVFDRTLDVGWRRASYSSITSALHDQPVVGSEPEQQLTSDEAVPAAPLARRDPDPTRGDGAIPLQLADMPGGALVGTVIHGVFEHTEFDVPDLASKVRKALAEEVAWRNVNLGNTEDVVSGLCAAIESPLGPMADGHRLCDITRGDRLDELTFEIPLVGGDAPSANLHVGAVADLLEEHLPADDPVAPYARAPARPRSGRGSPGVPDREPRPRLPATGRPLLRGRLQDQQAEPAGGDADIVALPACRIAGRNDRRPLPVAGTPLHRGAAPLPPLAASSLPSQTHTLEAPSTCSCAA